MKISGYLHEEGYSMVEVPVVEGRGYEILNKKEQACVKFVQFNELRFFKKLIPEEGKWQVVITDGDTINRMDWVDGEPDLFDIMKSIYNTGQWRYAFPSVVIEDVEKLVSILEG